VIFKEDRLGGRVRVTVEEERVPPPATPQSCLKTDLRTFNLVLFSASTVIVSDTNFSIHLLIQFSKLLSERSCYLTQCHKYVY